MDARSPAEMARRRHWHANRAWTLALLLIWAVVTFVLPYHARALNFNFFGWPFSFWVAAQGALLVFALLVAWYAHVMARLDEKHRQEANDD